VGSQVWGRRRLLAVSGGAALAPLLGRPGGERSVRFFLCGDVMTGRGVDQVLPHPSRPGIHERYADSALQYVELAERVNGPIPRPVRFADVWGDALAVIAERSPDLRLVNLETSVTTSEAALPKGINYRMHPANLPCLTAAQLDGCVLANNHVLDWGSAGLLDTLDSLHAVGLATAGAGRNARESERPAVLEVAGKPRVLVFGLGSPCSGIPPEWSATAERPGVSRLPDLSARSAEEAAARIRGWRRAGDIVVVSIHWGGNWGYDVPREQRELAHRLIDAGAADLVHGHSSHHPKGIEIYRDRLVLYGCGDFLNDYEGIGGHEQFHSELVLAYFPVLEASGRLAGLEMTPLRIRRLRLERARREDAEWLRRTLDRECRRLGTRLETGPEGALALRRG
jgi:poly-gamma-glutamate synthesis protein (capsule biosynthesis protein)